MIHTFKKLFISAIVTVAIFVGLLCVIVMLVPLVIGALMIFACWKASRFLIAYIHKRYRIIAKDRRTVALFWLLAVVPPSCILLLQIGLPVMHVLQNREIADTVAPADKKKKKALPTVKKYPCIEMTQGNLDALFYKSQLELACTDSIGLIIDLADSTISIALMGIPLRQCHISSYRLSPTVHAFTAFNRLHSWLGRPFRLTDASASIAKTPIRVRKAPRDSVEAQKTAAAPPLPPDLNVTTTLRCTRGLVVKISQVEAFQHRALGLRFALLLRDAGFSIGQNLVNTVKQRSFFPEIGISILCNRDDVKAIYRAVPAHAGIVVRVK